jgi:lipopolysaccharide export system protein LptA
MKRIISGRIWLGALLIGGSVCASVLPGIAVPQSSPNSGPNVSAPPASPSPGGSGERAHFHRPGTDVDGDIFVGSLASEVFILRGNVTLHSDPTVDRAIAAASESSDPLTVTADEIDVDRAASTYVAKGHVRFVQGTRSGQADTAMLNEEARTIDLIGHANVIEGDHRAAADKMHYDMSDKRFAGAGDVRIYQPLPTPNPNASSSAAPKKRKRRLPL